MPPNRRLAGALAIVLALASAPAAAAPPEVTISYGAGLDRLCALVRGYGIEPAWREELERVLPEFRLAWQARGPAILAAVERLTGRSFGTDEVTARLTLCDVPSNSLLGVVINMRHALGSFTARPVPLRYKATVLAHEVLHGFLADNPVGESALLREHAGEPAAVRDHLHLLALLKAALVETGDTEGLEEAVRIDGLLPGGTYRRAWELVNRTPEEYRRYVDEVRRGG